MSPLRTGAVQTHATMEQHHASTLCWPTSLAAADLPTCGISGKHAKVARGADAGAGYAHHLIPPGQDAHAQPIHPLGDALQQARGGLQHQPCAPYDHPQCQPCSAPSLVPNQRVSHNTCMACSHLTT